MKGRFSVVLSAHARSGGELADRVRERWGEDAADFCVTESADAFDKALSRAKNDGIETLIVGGGDGTVRRAAQALRGTDIQLGILPLGTGNALAHELGIPIAPEEAMEFFETQAVPARIDAGLFNSEVFVNVATVGITSRIVEAIANSPKGRFGRLVYIPALFRAVRFARSFSIRIESDGETVHERAVQFVAASSRQHGGPFCVTESASIKDGLLSVYLVKRGDRSTLFRYGLGLLTGKHTELPAVWSAERSRVRVSLMKSRRFVLDGDPTSAKEADIRIEAGALLALVSPDSEAAGAPR